MALWKLTFSPWLFLLGKKFFNVAPYRTALIVVSSLAAQVSLLLAFLLPLKIVMLLGVKTVPSYMPPPFDTMEHDTMIIVLSLLSLATYLFHLLAKRVTEYASEAGAKRMLEASRKIVLFENQDTIASTAYGKYAEALSSLTFSSLALAILGWIYSDVAVLIILVSTLAALTATVAAKGSHEIRQGLTNNTPAYVRAASGVGFLAIFAFIVVDFLALTPPNFLVAIVSIILGRQLMNQASLAARNISLLNKQKQKISALFFHNSTFDNQPPDSSSGIWRLLEEDQRDTWLSDLICQATRIPVTTYKAQWVQTNFRDVMGIKLELPAAQRTLIVKAFDKKKTALALHEATLLLEPPEGLPTPKLINVNTWNGLHCHVFDVSNLNVMTALNPTSFAERLKRILLQVHPSPDLTERYSRSKKMLWDKLDNNLVARLTLVADPAHHHRINRLHAALPTIKKSLKTLPMILHIPAPNKSGLVYTDTQGAPSLAHWEHWTVVPQGAGWPAKTKKDLESLRDALRPRPLDDNDSATHDSTAQQLAACLSTMLTHFDHQRYEDALSTLALADDLISSISQK